MNVTEEEFDEMKDFTVRSVTKAYNYGFFMGFMAGLVCCAIGVATILKIQGVI